MARATAEVCARGLGRAMPARRAMMGRHLRRVLGPELTGRALSRAVGTSFASYGRYWCEVFRLPEMALTGHGDRITTEGLGPVLEARDAGRGIVINTPHLGNWDLAAAWMSTNVGPVTTVVEVLEPPELFDWFCAHRRRLGLAVVPLRPEAGRTLLRALRDGGIVGLVSDRDITGTGVPVSFFGETTTLPSGPATMALRTGALLVAGATYLRPDGGHHVALRPPIDLTRRSHLAEDVARVTQSLAVDFEALIRRAPAQWHLLQPNWPSDLPGDAAPGSPGSSASR